MSMRAAIITLSDAGYAGQREDRSGSVIRELAEAAGYTVVHTALLPDGVEPLASELKRLCDGDLADLILTTGGTGFSPRDLTPEATRSVVERPVPGIAEAMRWQSLQITPRAMLSRAEAGIRRGPSSSTCPAAPRRCGSAWSLSSPPWATGWRFSRELRATVPDEVRSRFVGAACGRPRRKTEKERFS